jgi:molybdopterin-containing oxidoreductase family iron-sulfur binding subunit
MKLKFHHPEPSARELTGPRYWRSLDNLAATPAFKEWVVREFPAGASELEGVNRRHFLKIMAASFGLAGVGLSGCRQQTLHLLPYSKQPERMIPGVPIFYASSQPGPEENLPLIVETHDARPTKIEGNPSHAATGGATDIFAQASVLDLYDPDRAQRSSGADGQPMSPDNVTDKLSQLVAAFSPMRGSGLYFLSSRSTSPARARVVDKIRQKYPLAVWAEYEAIDQSNPERTASAWFETPARPMYDFAKAKRVLSLDSDFLQTEPGHLANARGFARARSVEAEADMESMNRLYIVESHYSLTGANADHRLRCATAQVPAVAALLAAELFTQAPLPSRQDEVMAVLKKLGAGATVDPKWVSACVKDLLAHKGAAAVIAGSQLPVELHQLVTLMNVALGAVGQTVTYRALPDRAPAASIADVAEAIDAKKVQTLVILNGNPAYNAPGDLNFAAKLKTVPVIRYGYYGRQADETSALAGTFIAGLHYLESWGDGLTWDGRHVPVQPMIEPLFEGLGELDVLGMLAGDPNADAFKYVQDTFTAMHPGKSFDEWLAVGVAGDEAPAVSRDDVGIRADALTAWTYQVPEVSEKSLEVRFIPGAGWDGRYTNNGWLQECPDPMTKLTWDNAILVSPKLGKLLGVAPEPVLMNKLGQTAMDANTFVKSVEQAQIGEITVKGRTIRGPVSILPGLANWTLVVALGYGRKLAGGVGQDVGFSASPLVSSAGAMACSVTGAVLKILPDVYQLANTQEHWSMEGRELVREANVTEFHEKPDFARELGLEAHAPPIYGPAKVLSPQEKAVEIPRGQMLYQTQPNNEPQPNYPAWNTPEGRADYPTPQQWGMSIDLNTCLGCNACVVACQAENNIPIVGKDQVRRGREMQWIRLDRYFASGPGPDGNEQTMEIPEDPQVAFQSIACMQCELAPCEVVCPFAATVHDDQGLNTMAYNRCVGTKYCANNCPYKVRRFNFFDWNKREIGHFNEGPLGPDYYATEASQLTRMQKNPDVTIRMRGVMEKCTYCVQRIEEAKINQRVKAQGTGNIKVPDGTIKTACQQVCPTQAIQFGDVSDAKSAVSIAKASPRNYAVLGYLNTRPRTTYLAKIRNPNPEMPDYQSQPLTREEEGARYKMGVPEGAAKAT